MHHIVRARVPAGRHSAFRSPCIWIPALVATCLLAASGLALPAPRGASGAELVTNGPAHRGSVFADGLGGLPALAHRVGGLTPLGGTAPRGHLLMSAGGSTRGSTSDSAGAAQPRAVSNGAQDLSSNWSGAMAAGSGSTFSSVQGDWVVPTVAAAGTDKASATWIGIDGVETSTLIQTGTAQNSGPDYGGTQYYAWVELLPGASQRIGTPVTAPVVPGDTIAASVSQDSPGQWTIALDDTTQGWSYTQQFSYSTPGITAEWIEEAPMVNGSLATLADYGSASFTNMAVGGTGLASSGLYPISMATTSGAIISYPADFNASTHSFSVFYGTPAPQVTSVSPNQGSTSGGTTVTVGGNDVTGVSAVRFGGVAVPFTADLADGTVRATTPAHSAGVIDITVTTPGGTSQPSSSDRFTYVTPPPAPPHGYWLVGSDGGIFTFGAAQFHGSTGSLHLQRPVVGIVPTTDHGGYWLDASDGGVFAFGDSGYYGSIPALGLNPAGSGLPNSLDAPIVGMVPSVDGGGYFMVASDGGIFAFGDARFAGSCPAIGGCSGAAVAVMPDASGLGYWVVTASGNVYTFGDAPYYGGPGGESVTVTSAVATPDGRGYWILFANGAVAAYGDARLYGDPVGQFGGFDPATAIFATGDGGGYWVASADGTVDDFGDAPNDGSMAGTPLNGPIIAATGW